jgi:hypothetical protein
VAALRSTERGSGVRLHCERATRQVGLQPVARCHWQLLAPPHIMAQLLVAQQTMCCAAHVAGDTRRAVADRLFIDRRHAAR